MTHVTDRPSRKPKREDDDPFGPLFREFEREFRRMQEEMSGLMEQALKNADIPKGPARPGNPFMYGFTMRLGPDGKPRFEHFGTTPPGLQKPEVAVEGGREPVTDLIEFEDHFAATVELPGVEKEDVQVYTQDQSLTIKVDTAQRKYYKSLQLGAAVEPEKTEATFKNGVLDVTLWKREQAPPQDRGHRVNVK